MLFFLSTVNGSTGMNYTLAIVIRSVVLCLILLVLSVGVSSFFCRRRKKRPQASRTLGRLHTSQTSPSAESNSIGIESSTGSSLGYGAGSEVSSRGYKREPSSHTQPSMPPHYSNFQSVISSRDDDNLVEEERQYNKTKKVAPTPPPGKDKGDSDKSGGENNEAAEVTPHENGKQCDEEGVTMFSVSDIEDD